MKTLLLAAAALSGLASPAAACHRFHTWLYPFPQRCPLPHSPALWRAPARIREASAPAIAEERRWFVEITAMPELTPQVMDEISHGVGIEKIRQLNQGHAK